VLDALAEVHKEENMAVHIDRAIIIIIIIIDIVCEGAY
jgi:hypothetical protein